MTLFFEKSYDEIPLKKWCEYQTVPHIHSLASPFVGGRELIILPMKRGYNCSYL